VFSGINRNALKKFRAFFYFLLFVKMKNAAKADSRTCSSALLWFIPAEN